MGDVRRSLAVRVALGGVLALVAGCIEYFPELPARPDAGHGDGAVHDGARPDGGPDGGCGSAEVCNGVDDDCDGVVDEGRVECVCRGPVGGDGSGEGCGVESCMVCHNGAEHRDDYSGEGLMNPHPFEGAGYIRCTGCHGGDPSVFGPDRAHIPPPPAIGDRRFREEDVRAAFLRTTLTGVERLTPDPYPGAEGREHSNLDYLQFVNPGDLRVVAAGRGCGASGCHGGSHAEWVPRSLHATSAGIFGATRFAVGVEGRVEGSRGRDGDSLADSAARAVARPGFEAAAAAVGEVGALVELPDHAQVGGPLARDAAFLAGRLGEGLISAAEDPARPNRVRAGSALEALVDAQLAMSCGDCHLWSAGANNRYADYRASGCTACHMPYSPDGRYRGRDGNIRFDEPEFADALQQHERAHVRSHQISSVLAELPGGGTVRGIDDAACGGCHSGSNWTVLQYWGVRLDQNVDVVGGTQYPARPDEHQDTAQDARFYDLGADNATYHGRGASQLVLVEDYDGDGRDDTPPDIHYERGLGCIDCHGGGELHGDGRIVSRMDQEARISCESCHGGLDAYAATAPCTTHDGRAAECAVDRTGAPLRHVTKGADGHYWLQGRVDGHRHYLPQTRDIAVDTGRSNPDTFRDLYSPKASYAMGRADGDPLTGTGPLQADERHNNGYSHLDDVECATCHAAWTNNCIGCHLGLEVDLGAAEYAFGNISGERVITSPWSEDVGYQSPVLLYLGVDSSGKIGRMSPAEKAFWRFLDREGDTSRVFTFGDRLGAGNSPGRDGRSARPALGLNPMSPHSIRGKVDGRHEGPIYCVGCHINVDVLEDVATVAAYDAFVAAYEGGDYAALDYELLARHIGQNPGNQLGSPFYVRMAAGLGTGLFLTDAEGCPINPLDPSDTRAGCEGESPAAGFAERVGAVAHDLDRLVEATGVENVSTSHPRLTGGGVARDGASNPEMAGPLGARVIERLVGGETLRGGIVLDAWLDADGALRGDAGDFVR